MPTLSTAICVPGTRRARIVLACAAAVASVALGAAPSQARTRPHVATICAAQATLYETPGGAKVGILHRGDRVRVIAASAGGRWWRVAAAFGTHGWLRTSAICGRQR